VEQSFSTAGGVQYTPVSTNFASTMGGTGLDADPRIFIATLVNKGVAMCYNSGTTANAVGSRFWACICVHEGPPQRDVFLGKRLKRTSELFNRYKPEYEVLSLRWAEESRWRSSHCFMRRNARARTPGEHASLSQGGPPDFAFHCLSAFSTLSPGPA